MLLYREPRSPGVRIDSGIAEGTEVSVHYDPLLAKVIASAESRDLARVRLIAALRDFPILGVHTNIPFLLRILEHPRFRAGDVDTAFLDSDGASLAEAGSPEPPRLRSGGHGAADGPADVAGRDRRTATSVGSVAAAARTGGVDGRRTLRHHASRPGRSWSDVGDRRETVYVAGPPADRWAFWRGEVFHVDLVSLVPEPMPPAGNRPRAHVAQSLSAPMPATVIRVLVAAGSRVKKGETLVLLEAMKMELPIRSLSDGTIAAVRCREGELVRADQILIVME